jgi:hypothetical protein
MDVANVRDNISKALEKEDCTKFWKNVTTLIKATPVENRTEVLDIIGAASITNPNVTGFMQLDFDKFLLKKLKFDDILELEKYIIEKYCLYPSETILASCFGKMTFGKKFSMYGQQFIKNGRFYITPYRIIAGGPIIIPGGGGGIGGIILTVVISRVIQKIKEQITSKMADKLGEKRGSYCTNLATFDPYDIEIMPKYVAWKVDIDYKDDKGKDKKEKLIYKLDFKNGPKEPKDGATTSIQNFVKIFEQVVKK